MATFRLTKTVTNPSQSKKSRQFSTKEKSFHKNPAWWVKKKLFLKGGKLQIFATVKQSFKKGKQCLQIPKQNLHFFLRNQGSF